MKKHFKKLSLALIFAMAVSFIAPAARVADAATTKTFTYAEQVTGDTVTSLVMDKGEKVDLKFNGVSNWKTYSYKWVSSNTKVAVVDSAGVVTAMGTGVATIKLTISGGDGTKFSSTGVTVYVGLDQNVTIGTSATPEIKSYTLEMGNTVALKANGLKDNVGDRYTFTWSSTDTTVATVASNGLVTPKAPGLTVIQLTVKKNFSGATMVATPIALLVTGEGTYVPVATATPAPTQKPGATATPTPTATPVATATPTPTPVIAAGSYSVSVVSDKSIAVNFGSAVTIKADDIVLSEVLQADGQDILIKEDIKTIDWDESGKKLTITTEDPLKSGRYNIKFGDSDQGRIFQVTIGVPNRIDIIYTCMGRENTAYAYDDEAGIEVPVNLTYKLYYGNVDVTETYENSGNVEYELVAPIDSDYVFLDTEQVYFYAPKQTAVVRGTFTYYTETGEKQLKDTVSIVSKEIGDYAISHVANWTIIDTTSTEPIDWDNPVKKVVADKDNFKVVALLADTYGFYYSTDDRGVDKSKNIYSVDDGETLFSLKGYSYSFNSSNDDKFFIDDTGELYTFDSTNRAAVYITLYNPDDRNGERNIGAWYFTIQEASRLNSLKSSVSKVTLLEHANNNEERFCETDVVITVYDQYNYKWTGDAYLEVSSTISAINDHIDEAASITKGDNAGEWILHIDGKELASLTTKSTVSLTVTDEETRKKTTVTVNLKNPGNSNGLIVVDDWAVGMKESTITFGDGSFAEVDAQAVIELYQVSKTGSYNVGILTNGYLDENDNIVKIIMQKSKTQTFNASNCKPGEVYVLVTGPDGKVVDFAKNSSDLGLYQDPSTGAVTMNVTKYNGNTLSYMKEGVYNVKVTKITKLNNSSASKTIKNTSFTVVDNTKDVTISGYNGTRTSLSVSGNNDPDIKNIVLELFNFKLGDMAWTSITEENITSVTYSEPINNRIRITAIEFAVPADGNNGGVTYQKKINLSKSITINAED